MRITIIGGSGFLGSHVADNLSQKKNEVVIFDKKKSKYLKSNQIMILGDVTKIQSLRKAIRGSDIVYHFAGISDIGESIKKPSETVKINIIGIANILQLCKKYKVKRIILASTIYVSSSQGGFYRVSKQASELMVEEYKKRFGLNYTIIRFGSIYGPRSSKNNGLTKIIFNLLKHGNLQYGGTSKARRRFIHVVDAAKSSVEMIKGKYKNKKILITGKNTIKITSVLKIISEILKINKKPTFSNKKQLGHYDMSPYSYKPIKTKNFILKNSINFKKGISDLVRDIKDQI